MQTINNRQTYKTPEFYNSKEARHKVIEGELVVCSGPVRVGKQQATLKKLVHKHVRHIYIYVHAYTYYIYIYLQHCTCMCYRFKRPCILSQEIWLPLVWMQTNFFSNSDWHRRCESLWGEKNLQTRGSYAGSKTKFCVNPGYNIWKCKGKQFKISSFLGMG